MSRKGRKPRQPLESQFTLDPSIALSEIGLPVRKEDIYEGLAPTPNVWAAQKEGGIWYLTRSGAVVFNRQGVAALTFDSEQAALDFAEALNEAHRRRKS
jgi:hypothetical protein